MPPFLTSCPIHGAAADSENMEGGSICNVVMGIGMYISYQPVALIVFIASLGSFKCYVMQMGVGGVSDFLEKSVTKV